MLRGLPKRVQKIIYIYLPLGIIGSDLGELTLGRILTFS